MHILSLLLDFSLQLNQRSCGFTWSFLFAVDERMVRSVDARHGCDFIHVWVPPLNVLNDCPVVVFDLNPLVVVQIRHHK